MGNSQNFIVLLVLVPVLASVLLLLNKLLAQHRPDEAKLSAFESGMPPILGQTRSPFDIGFIKVTMFFLLFDLEIVLVFPGALTLFSINSYGFIILFIFLVVLTIGFVLEIASGSISQTKKYETNN
jgi:NADH-ubiquinone oxidoreductase chain 3